MTQEKNETSSRQRISNIQVIGTPEKETHLWL